MPDVFRTAFRGGEAPACFVIHCSDPRFQPHFQEFLRTHVREESYGLIAVPGGAQFLTLAEYLPKFSWAGWRWVKFLGDFVKPRRVVLIAHDDCRWYLDGRFLPHGAGLRERAVEDLKKVRAGILERFPGARVELYFVRLEGGQAVFEAV